MDKKDIMEMSLDEIIARSKGSDSCAFTASNNCNYNKFGRRNEMDQEDDEDMLLKSEGEEEKEKADTGIWKGPEATVAYIDCDDSKNDLRQKLSSENMNRVSTIQYRLQYPNNSSDRPRGMPTLLPIELGEPNYQKTNNYVNRPYRKWKRGFNNYYNKRNSYHTDNQRNGLNYSNNGRNYGERNKKNSRITFNRGNYAQTVNKAQTVNEAQTVTKARNIYINVPSTSINLSSTGPVKSTFQEPTLEQNRSMPIGGITPQAKAILDVQTNHDSNTSNDNLKSWLGFSGNMTEDMMPHFANKLLAFVQQGVQDKKHKTVYDMKIQKEIHDLQNKPLRYKCNGGDVISSDGDGLQVAITPTTSGLSLNCRFA